MRKRIFIKKFTSFRTKHGHKLKLKGRQERKRKESIGMLPVGNMYGTGMYIQSKNGKFFGNLD